MRKHILEVLLVFSVCASLGTGFLFLISHYRIGIEYAQTVGAFFDSEIEEAEHTEEQEPQKILFVGDLMLARAVERTMNTYGAEYPYQFMDDLFEEHVYQIANFEGAIPKVHTKTEDMTYQFSVDPAFIPVLQSMGFTHVSLANNHSFDFGIHDFTNTKAELYSNSIEPFGIPKTVGTSSLVYLDTEDKTSALLALDYTVQAPDSEAVTALLTEAKTHADIVVVFVHWGTEYSPKHSKEQEAWAKFFATQGVDLVIGHHPHVVQDVQKVDNTIVFYSIGNFIFDQYFDTTVQEGLTLSFDPLARKITLIPITTLDSRMAPRPMPEVDRYFFLDALAKKSDSFLKDSIEAGTMVF